MPDAPTTDRPFDIVIVAQAGRLQFEAVLFAASLRQADPEFPGRLIVMEPEPGPLWPGDPRMDEAPRALLATLGAEIHSFPSRHFGASYPQGNKIEALSALDDGPFVFLDTDTLITGRLSALPIDFARPSASMRREGIWPVIEPYGPGYTEIWQALHERFHLDFASSLDLSQPDEHWERYLYFNAGWFFGPSGPEFGRRFLEIALSIRDDTPAELVCQPLDPWLDQIALPLVIHGLGGGRPGPELAGLDGEVTCHYRVLPLLYARECDRTVELLEYVAAPNAIKKVLKQHDPFKRMIYQRRGVKARALFDRDALPRREQAIRNRLKSAGLWMR